MSLQARMKAKLIELLPEAEMAPEYDHSWKDWPTPNGEPIAALRSRAKKVPVTVGWPSPRSMDATSNVETPEARMAREGRAGLNLPTAATLAGWPTPDTGRDESLATWQARLERMRERHPDKGGMGSTGPLHVAAQLAGWPTPMAGSPATENYNAAGNTDSSRKTESLLAPLGGWGTPTTQDSRHATFSDSQQQRDPNVLNNQVFMADLTGWGTPTSQTFGDTPETHLARKQKAIDGGATMGLVVSTLHAQSHLANLAGWATPTANEKARSEEFRAGRELNAREAFGITSPSSSVGTAKPAASRGSLNAGFSGWLMGYPLAWMACGMLASIASRSRPAKSKGGSCS